MSQGGQDPMESGGSYTASLTRQGTKIGAQQRARVALGEAGLIDEDKQEHLMGGGENEGESVSPRTFFIVGHQVRVKCGAEAGEATGQNSGKG